MNRPFYKQKKFWLCLAGLGFLAALIIALNLLIIRKLDDARAMSEGQMQLTSITAEAENNLYQAECIVDSLAGETEFYLSQTEANENRLSGFVKEKTKYVAEKTQNAAFSVSIAYDGNLYTEGFVPGGVALENRQWFKGAKSRHGKIFFTAPYLNSRTGKMCYSASKLLSDGQTVISVDYSTDRIQSFVEDMGKKNGGICLIVNEDGTIIGHTSPENVGRDYSQLSYADVIKKVFSLYGNSFAYEFDDKPYNVFSDKTSYGWYLIVCVENSQTVMPAVSYEIYLIIFLLLLLFAAIIGFFIYSYRSKEHSEHKAEQIRRFMEKMPGTFSAPKGKAPETNLLANTSDSENIQNAAVLQKKQRRAFGCVLLILAFTGTTMLAINTYSQIRSISGRMQGESAEYCNQAKEWMASNKARVNMISQAFVAQPGLVEDRDRCVKFFNDIVKNNANISIAYIVNPAWKRPVITNTGWEPADPSWRIEERPWYIETINSRNGFNISAPYIDELTGLYCVTISQIVNDQKGNHIGVLGVDYYMDKLISILGESYNDEGYAFLVDQNYNIINHPNDDYQITKGTAVNAGTLCYREAIASNQDVLIRDYDGSFKICRMQEEKISGFSVLLVKNCLKMYGYLLISASDILVMFGICIIIVALIMKKLTLMHEQVQKELTGAAEKATAASRAKDDFLANMSHEIRTPMNAVVGMTELILREKDISRTVKDYCYSIQNSGKNLLAIINDILDFSKIESGRLEIINEQFNIASMLNDVINMAMTKIGHKELTLIVMADPNIPVGLVGDEIRINQVIINLMTNAIKYTREGCVCLKIYIAKNDNGTPLMLNGRVTLNAEVIDTGIGITDEDMGKLFNSFQQLDTKKNRSIEGTGLGLAISKRLLEQMDGSLTVKSTYGKGSAFAFQLPLKVADATPFLSVSDAENVQAALYIDLARFNIPEVRDYYRLMLDALPKQLGIKLDSFYSLADFQQHLAEKKYTHIITGKHEYLANESFFRPLPEIFIIQKRSNDEIRPTGAKSLYEPFCTLSLVAALNNESPFAHVDAAFDSKFIAPEARVLIVDDNAVNLQVAEELMRPYKMNIITAASAADALAILRTTKDIDIIFMDHMMPEIDGVEATGMIRKMDDDYYQKVPIIALTANAVNGAKEIFLTSGMNDFIAKPIDPKTLDRAIRRWLPESLIEIAAESEETEDTDAADVPAGDDTFSPKTGIFYAGGSLETYHTILKSYLGKGREKAALINKLFAAKDWSNYVIEVHALKSTSMTIGAKILSELAKELEFAGKEGNYRLIEEKNQKLLTLYEEVIDKGEKYLSPDGEEKGVVSTEPLLETTVEKVDEWISRILAACDDFNAAQVKETCKAASNYIYQGVKLRPLFEEVESAADEFEFEKAAEKARAIREKL